MTTLSEICSISGAPIADALRSATHHGFGALVEEIDRVQA